VAGIAASLSEHTTATEPARHADGPTSCRPSAAVPAASRWTTSPWVAHRPLTPRCTGRTFEIDQRSRTGRILDVKVTGAIMFLTSPGRKRDTDRSERSVLDDLPALEAILRHWLRGRARPDVVLTDPDGGAAVPLDVVLVRLRASSAPLDRVSAARLGLPPGSGFADAAEDLLFARHDPAGPRCRSFRSASYYLYGLARIDPTSADPQPAHRPGGLRPTREPSSWIDGASSGGQPAPGQPVVDPSAEDAHAVREGAGR
jgi:hypothetical protein